MHAYLFILYMYSPSHPMHAPGRGQDTPSVTCTAEARSYTAPEQIHDHLASCWYPV